MECERDGSQYFDVDIYKSCGKKQYRLVSLACCRRRRPRGSWRTSNDPHQQPLQLELNYRTTLRRRGPEKGGDVK